MRPWLETVLKVVVMGLTVCCGVIVAKYEVPMGDEGHEEGRGTRQSQQELDRAASLKIHNGLESQIYAAPR